MSIFKSEKYIAGADVDLDAVARELAEHFRERNYRVEHHQDSDSSWMVSITRGGVFKKAVGLQSAHKVQLETKTKGTMVRAGAGVFGKQAVPTAITIFVAWPVLLAQVWGLIREAGLDDEAIRVVEITITRLKRLATVPQSGADDQMDTDPQVESPAKAASGGASGFCTDCGTAGDPAARFCANCGATMGGGV